MPFRLFLFSLAAVSTPLWAATGETLGALKKDVAYVENGHARQKLDLRLPADPKGAPVVLWIHGGGWLTGSKENPPVAALTAKGYVVASMNYRYSTQAPFPAQLEDARAAVKWLRTHQTEFGYDGKRIAAWGHSAGGTHVASYVFDRALGYFGQHTAGAVLISARLRADVSPENPNAEGVRAYFGDDPARYEQRSTLSSNLADRELCVLRSWSTVGIANCPYDPILWERTSRLMFLMKCLCSCRV